MINRLRALPVQGPASIQKGRDHGRALHYEELPDSAATRPASFFLTAHAD